MKKILSLLCVAILFAACSTPKYAAHFPSSNVETGYHTTKLTASESQQTAPVPTHQGAETLTASVSAAPLVLPADGTQKHVKEAYNQLSKPEKKKVRQLLKKEIKAIVKNSKKNTNTATTHISGEMDHDLKLAAIFGAVGLVGLLIGGNFFSVIGAIAMIIGLVFFVKWLIRQ
ncbi:MAG: hypothetical protein ACKO96_03255 [Flammeovirgaceae bacterium]